MSEDPDQTGTEPTSVSRSGGVFSILRDVAAGEFTAVWLATAALFVLSLIIAGSSLSSTAALTSTLALAAILAIASTGQTVIVQQRGIDLSIAGNMTLCGLVLPLFMTRSGGPLIVGIAAVVVTAIIIGLANGLIVTRFAITPLITTLAMNSILLGAVLSYGEGVTAADSPPSLQHFATAKWLGVPSLLWVAIAVVLGFWLVLRYTPVGRKFVAVGSNPATARASGINVMGYVLSAYVIGSLCFGFAAILLVGYLGNATISLGNDYLFPSIAAVVVGGTSLAGGRGSVIATAIAALFLTQLDSVLNVLGAPASAQYLAQAIAIALAAATRSITLSQAIGPTASWMKPRRGGRRSPPRLSRPE